MDGKVIYAPDYVDVKGPLIFLAGPIQGTYFWQDKAIKIIQNLDPEMWIASPRRAEIDKDFIYEKQVDWETHYLRRAAQKGALFFWLAKEIEHNCERPFAQTSRFELGEWKIKHEKDGIKLVIGIEKGFTNARYIKRRLSQDCPEIKIYSSLEETCKMVVEEAKKWI